MRSIVNVVLIVLSLIATVSNIYATPVVASLFKGGGPSSGAPNSFEGMNEINNALRDQFIGRDFYSRVFEFNQINEAENYINLFPDDSKFVSIGHSRGGWSALELANSFEGGFFSVPKNFQSIIQLDSFRCVFLGCIDNLELLIGNDPVHSSGTQTIPTNVANAINYFQVVTDYDQNLASTENFQGYLLQGETDVVNSNNINVETYLSDATITHLNIDNNRTIQQEIIDSIFPSLSTDVLLSGLGGPAGFGELAMGRNDDGSSNRLNLPFNINLGENTYDSFFINNNGNLTFESSLGAFTPLPFPISNQPMIAPFWGDVDTRCSTCGEVYVASPASDTVVVTWDDVGYYSNHSDKTNVFQLVVRDRSDDTQTLGNFDVEFHYKNLTWTTGDASGGSNGLGGIPAQAGFDEGNGSDWFQLPGSRTSEILNVQNSSNLTKPFSGVWGFSFRDGSAPGQTAANPLLPDAQDNGWVFEFGVGDVSDTIFIDPFVAIGYDYVVDSGPNFRSVLLPTGIGDNLFDLQLFDNTFGDFSDTGIDILGGDVYNFGLNGVDAFRVLGIEPNVGLDPNDVTAFITGLSFINTGLVSMRQIPITFDTDAPQPVPEPSTFLLLATGLAGIAFVKKRMGNHT